MTERLLMSGEEPSPEEVDAIAAPPAPSRARREDDEDADEDGKGAQDGDGGSGDDESLVADASQVSCNGRAHLWRLPEIIAGESGAEQPAAEYMEHTAAVCSVALGETLAVSAGSVDCTARVWPLSRRGRTASVAVLRHPAAVFSVSVNFASTLAATGCADGNVWLWSLTTWELYQQDAEITPVRILDHTGMDSVSPVSCVRLINDMLVSGGQDGHVKVWSVASATGECITTIHKALGDSLDGSDTVECVQAVAASAFGYVAVAGGNKLVIWRPKNAPPPPPPPPKQPPVKRRASLFSGVKR